MVIFNTTDTITASLSSTITTNQMQCYSTFTNSGELFLNKIFNTNSLENIAVLDSPSVNNKPCKLLSLTIFNKDTATNTVLIKINTNIIYRFTLAVNETLFYNGLEWYILDANGLIKTQNISNVTNAVNTVILEGNVINNNATANTLQDVSGLQFTATSGVMYKFEFNIFYTSAATTTGSRWSINAPSFDLLTYTSEYTLTSGTTTRNPHLQSVNLPAASNATSTLTNNYANIKGVIKTNSTGVVIARFASEVASSAITALAGSFVEYTAK